MFARDPSEWQLSGDYPNSIDMTSTAFVTWLSKFDQARNVLKTCFGASSQRPMATTEKLRANGLHHRWSVKRWPRIWLLPKSIPIHAFFIILDEGFIDT
jgi:hypothetical protein